MPQDCDRAYCSLQPYSSVPAFRWTTRHAGVRCQQRGISQELLGLLLDHGIERHVGGGATILSFPKHHRKRLSRCLSRREFAAVSSRLDVYAVVGSNGKVMTVGHRYKPMREKH